MDDLIAGLAPALIDCNCDVDLPSLRSALWRLFVTKPMQVLAFDATTRTQRLALPADTPWADASARLSPTVKGLELAVE